MTSLFSYFRLEVIEVRKTVENAASDGFRLNCSCAAFCLPHQLVGFFFHDLPKAITGIVLDVVKCFTLFQLVIVIKFCLLLVDRRIRRAEWRG